MRLFLVGYMGSGKSTLGRQLARVAGLHFIDLDKYIEERHCRSVQQLFAEEGEAVFRTFERNALSEVAEFDEVVVATGGGAPCFFDNMELMNRTGITVFIDIDPQILARRLMTSKTVRPLIAGKSKQELIAFIAENLEKRRVYYKKSRIVVRNPDMDVRQILSLIENINP